jgi:hypothetical protein
MSNRLPAAARGCWLGLTGSQLALSRKWSSIWARTPSPGSTSNRPSPVRRTERTIVPPALPLQRNVPYTEPPYVYYPTRRTLGAAYLLANQPSLATQEFLQTLIENPIDAYAYWGLAEASRMRGDMRGAAAANSMFEGVFIGPRASIIVMNLWLKCGRVSAIRVN